MKSFKMDEGNDCGAFVASVADIVCWTQESSEIIFIGVPDRWINLSVSYIKGVEGDPDWWEGTIENHLGIQIVKKKDFDLFRTSFQKMARYTADEVGMFNG